jgi:hypothetical protein
MAGGRGVRRITQMAVCALLALAMLPAASQASQLSSVSVKACVGGSGSCSLTETFRVDQNFGLEARLQLANGLSNGSRLYLEGPEGFSFGGAGNPHLTYGTGIYSMGSYSTFNGGRGFEVELNNGLLTSVPAGATVELSVGFFENKISSPPKPGQFHIKAWSSADAQARESSNVLTTTLGEPSTLKLITPSISGTVGQVFAEQPFIELLDSRGNKLSGKTVTFEVPAAEPSGSYTGGTTSVTGTTDANGIATPSAPLAAGHEAGEWDLTVLGPNSTSTTIPMTNLVGGASQVEIDVEPTTLPADGSSTAEATIEVTDEFGNQVTGDQVSIDTGGGPSATNPALQGDGTYTSELTASTAPGEFTITATDTTAEPDISGSTTLTQSKLPAASIELTVQPSIVAADPLEKPLAVATVRDELGQPVSGDEVEFESPSSGEAQAGTDSGDGTYTWTVPVTTEPGEYEITATDNSVVPGISGSATLTQTPRPAVTVKVSLQPASIMADGKSTAVAVATVTDRLGDSIAGDEVKFSSSGGNAVGPTVDHGDGTYTAVVTASTVPGDYTVTASDATAAISGTAKLVQTPAPSARPGGPGKPQGSSSAAPAVKIEAGPKGTVHGRKARFRFSASGAASFECRLDGGRWKRCTSPAVFTVKPGGHVFRVRALNATGAAGPVAKRKFKRAAAKHRRHRRGR